MSRIVVGVDGSDHAVRAMHAALEEARLRDATLEVVYAVPELYLMADPVMVPIPPREDLESEGQQVVDGMLEDFDPGGVEIVTTITVGSAASVLCRVAKGADMLVVGSRGYGGFRGLLVGSVTQQVVAHAPCPVMVVVPDDR